MKTLLVASTGGHLAELRRLAERVAPDNRLWVTFDTPQSRSLLQGEDVRFSPPATSRDVTGTLKNVRFARNLFKTEQFGNVVSTGAAVAAAFLPLARRHGMEAHYIESATRLHGPSMTGKIMTAARGVHLYTQYDDWSSPRWRFAGSVFDDFTPVLQLEQTVRKIVVSLGTHRTYSFDRAIRHLAKVIPPNVEVLWQAGVSNEIDLDLPLRDVVPADELRAAIEEADAVITHAGVGSALTALEAGKLPIFLPRRKMHNEHVDDHQLELAQVLESRGLALTREADAVTWEDIESATNWTVTSHSSPPTIQLSKTRKRHSDLTDIRN